MPATTIAVEAEYESEVGGAAKVEEAESLMLRAAKSGRLGLLRAILSSSDIAKAPDGMTQCARIEIKKGRWAKMDTEVGHHSHQSEKGTRTHNKNKL